MKSDSDFLHLMGAILLPYLIGSIPWGFLIGKFNGIDIRRYGSRNIGATNVLRVLGKGWGYFCFLLDFLKGAVPVFIVQSNINIDTEPWVPVIAAAAVVFGHVFPVYLGFRGGKGVATTIGVLLALAPLPLLGCLIAWLVVFQLTRYVSLASCVAAAMFPLLGILQRFDNAWRGGKADPSTPTLCLLFILGAIIIYRHKDNLQRLRNGTENRFDRSHR